MENDIPYEIAEYCKKWGRIDVMQAKWKFNQVRVYVHFGLTLQSLIFPGYYRSRFPKWLHGLCLFYIDPALQYLFDDIWIRYQSFIYKKAYLKAIKKYPEEKEAIINGMDYKELLEGYL